MKEERLEQLRKVFKTAIEETIGDVKKGMNVDSKDVINTYAKAISNRLVYEVKIRINNK